LRQEIESMWWTVMLLMAGAYEDGLRLLATGRLTEARKELARAVESSPRHADAWKALGVVAGQMGDLADAEEAFRKACEIAPQLEDACYYHARSLYTLNRFVPAIATLERLRAMEPRRGRLLTALGQAYEANGEGKKAEESFRQAIAQKDAPLESRLHYGMFLFRAGRVDEAEGVMRAALELAPGNGRVLGELGRILLQQGNAMAAIPYLERAASQLEWAAQLLEKAKRRAAAKVQP
jgi:Flp pilus assembly protein TadD